MTIRLFSYVRVKSATGKSHRRSVGVRKAKTTVELAAKFVSNVQRFVTDPVIKSMTIDVRIPPSPQDFDRDDLAGMRDAGEDAFAYRHNPEATAAVVALLKEAFPNLTISPGQVNL
jgi:hypothetical protein